MLIRMLQFYLVLLAWVGVFASTNSNWSHFSAPIPIVSSTIQGDTLWLATGGGLQRMLPDYTTQVFTSANGLEETSHLGVAVDSKGGVWAVSEKGLISKWNPSQKSFSTVHRSFSEKGERLKKGLIASAKENLILVFDNSFSIFETSTNKSNITIRKVLDKDLAAHPLQNILVVKDTLFVAIDSAIYARIFHWDNLSADLAITDPNTWKIKKSASFAIKNFWLSKDTLVVDSLGGSVVVSSAGIDRVLMGKNGLLQIAGVNKKDSLWCPNDSCSAFWMNRSTSGAVWFGDSTRIARYAKKNYTLAPVWQGIPAGHFTALSALSDGGVVAWSTPNLVWLQGENLFTGDYNAYGVGDDSRGQDRSNPMKSLIVDGYNNLYLGMWGGGVVAMAGAGTNAGGTYTGWYSKNTGSCIDAYIGPAYTIVVGAAQAPQGQGSLFSYWGQDQILNGGLAYVNEQGTMSCLQNISSRKYPGPLVSSQTETGWQIFSSFSDENGSKEAGGIDRFITSNPLTSGSFVLQQSTMLITHALGSPRDLYWDEKNQRLWVLGSSGIGYWETAYGGDSITQVTYLQGYQGADLTGLDMDRQGDLWITSRDKGVYKVSLLNNKADSLIFENIRCRDGLLSDLVYDVAVSKLNGEVWFAHNNGISKYKNIAIRNTEKFQASDSAKVNVYPNPFRPQKQPHVYFDQLAETAELVIRDGAGVVVKRFKGNKGGRVKWDGLSDSHKLVSPGVYTWVAVQGKQTRKGRLIIIW